MCWQPPLPRIELVLSSFKVRLDPVLLHQVFLVREASHFPEIRIKNTKKKNWLANNNNQCKTEAPIDITAPYNNSQTQAGLCDLPVFIYFELIISLYVVVLSGTSTTVYVSHGL